MEFVIILILLVLNGLLAMYEIALVSSSKIRLSSLSKDGRKNARRVLRQLENPEQTMSTIQIGITLIGIVSGAFGGMALTEDVQVLIEEIPFLLPYASTVALVLTVAVITYLSLVIGELVPKAMALSHPERYAMLLSGPVAFITWICYPFVSLLSISTKCVGKLLGVKADSSRPMTQEEIKMMLQESSEQGVLDPHESEMIKDVFRFSDKRVSELMTPRHELVVFHLNDTKEKVVNTIAENNFSKYLLVGANRDEVIGVVSVKDIVLLLSSGSKKPFSLKEAARPALFLPESISARKAVELFKHNQTKFGVVVNEYGGTEGIVTLHDLTESVFGDILEENETPEPDIVRRQDGSLLIEGSMNVNDFFEDMKLPLPAEIRDQSFNTVGGMAMFVIGRVPHTGDCFEYQSMKFEVVDMDGERVDKLLVMPQQNN